MKKLLVVALGALLAGCSLLAEYGGLQGEDDAPAEQPVATTDAEGTVEAGTTTAETGAGCEPSCAGDASVPEAALETLFTATTPRGITVRDGDVFWVTTAPAGVWHAKPSAMPARVDNVADAVDDPYDVDVSGAYVYWSELSGNRVRRKPLLGGATENLAPGSGRSAYLVVVGDTSYVSDDFVDEPTRGSIVANGMVLYPNLLRTTGLGTDGTVLFWAHANGAGAFAVRSGTFDGANSTSELASIANPSGLAVDAAFIYVVTEQQRIVRKARGNLAPPEVVYASPTPFGPGDLAVDATYLYWTEPLTGRIRRLPKRK